MAVNRVSLNPLRVRSIGDLLVYLTYRWAATIESKGESLSVSLDMAKAFDRVWLGALLAKLPTYGLLENLCKWIASFLTGHSITLRQFLLGIHARDADVPQGCVLSYAVSSVYQIHVRGF